MKDIDTVELARLIQPIPLVGEGSTYQLEEKPAQGRRLTLRDGCLVFTHTRGDKSRTYIVPLVNVAWLVPGKEASQPQPAQRGRKTQIEAEAQ